MTDNIKDLIIDTLTQFKTDLIIDDFLGIFEKVPAHVKELLDKLYKEALEQASIKLNLSIIDLQEIVEEKAVEIVDGMSFSERYIEERIASYQQKQ